MNQTNIDFSLFFDQCKTLKKSKKNEISQIKPIYIFGAGKFGRNVAKTLKVKKFNVKGFIETTPKVSLVDGLPMFAWNDLSLCDFNAQLFIGIYNRDTPLDKLICFAKLKGFNDVLLPWDFYEELSDDLGWRYWLSDKQIILNNINNIKNTFDLLSDEESKKTLLDICSFRLGLNNAYASFKHKSKQYFNDLTLDRFADNKSYSFIDCGAYNGDTLIEAAKCMTLKNAYLFEPDLKNFNKLFIAVSGLTVKPICFPLAVSDRYQIMSFHSEGEGATISPNGENSIAAVALDEVFPSTAVDFIKFDVEGGEISAIKGAEKIIKRSRPVLAIAAYHRPDDLWNIPKSIFKFCDNYNFYLRQHCYNSFDSVFYAIPK